MIKLLIKWFIKDSHKVEDKQVREAYSMLSGILGILCNLILFGIKLSIGLIMNSIAIISDAFNNVSDMGSSLISIISAKMSNRRPDKEHPFGHGRLEYISALIVSFMIMLVGFELLKSSFKNILHPPEMNFNITLIFILILSMSLKIWMFSYNRYIAQKIHSNVIKAAAFDSLSDVIATGVVVLSSIANKFLSFPIDGIAGLGVSLMIMYTGFDVAKETIGILLGTPPSKELVKKLNEIILSAEGIVGSHDLIVHDYGPGRVMVSVHAEVPDDVDIIKTHEAIDAIEQQVLQEMGIHIVIHMDPISVNCKKTNYLKDLVKNIVKDVDERLNIHDFRMVDGEHQINLIFDLEVPYEIPLSKRKEIVALIKQKIAMEDERYKAVIQVDDSF